MCLEYHANTLTDTCDSTIRLLQEAEHSNLKTLWQPSIGLSPEQRLADLKRVAPWLEYVHTYHWKDRDRLPLADGVEEWRLYLKELDALPGDRYALLEFVRGDDPAQLADDAKALRRLAADVSGGGRA